MGRLTSGLPGQDADHRRGRVVANEPAAVVGQADACVRNLALTALPAQLLGQLDDLRGAGGADRVPLAQQSARGGYRCLARDLGDSLVDQAAATARLAKAEILVGDQLGWGRGV